jgi:hypothetical protein
MSKSHRTPAGLQANLISADGPLYLLVGSQQSAGYFHKRQIRNKWITLRGSAHLDQLKDARIKDCL